MKLTVVTPQGAKVRDLEIEELTLPGEMGEMGVLSGHVAMMAAVGVGPMVVRTRERELVYAVAGGFVEILGDTVRLLTETCEAADEIDVERAKAKLAEAQEKLKDLAPVDGEKYEVALWSYKKAETRISVTSGTVSRT